MSVDKITNPPSLKAVIDKINQVIEDTTVDQTYDASSTKAQSGSAVAEAVSGKQDTLISGTNIKTINNINILGSGNIDVSGGGGTTTPTWGNIAGTLSDQTDLNNALNDKQDELVSGTNIKTINGTSILGSGNISTAPAIDGDTISYNASDELQAIALVDSRDSTPRPVWTGTKAQYNALQSIDDNMLYNVTDDDDSSYINIVRSLGQIVTSTIPLIDSGLHLLDGSLLYEAGAYKDFVDYIAELYNTTPTANYFCTEADWQTSVTNYGVCGKFVINAATISSTVSVGGNDFHLTGTRRPSSDITYNDNVYAAWYVPELNGDVYTESENAQIGDTILVYENGQFYDTYWGQEYDVESITAESIRLPKITGIVQGTTDITELGDLVEAGLPNITGSFSTHGLANDVLGYGVFQGSAYTIENSNGYGNGNNYSNKGGINVPFNASNSNIIYGNSNTVQPQTIKCYYYIVIATSTKTEIEVDIDEIATDLNGKLDIDGNNCSASLSNIFMNNLMPDYSKKMDVSSTLTLETSAQDRSYPYPVMIIYGSNNTNVSGYGVCFECQDTRLTAAGYNHSVSLNTVFVPANTTFKLFFSGGGTPNSWYGAYVYPLKGANS